MITARALLVLALFTTLALPQVCGADDFLFSGYIKSYALAQDSITIETLDAGSGDQSIAGNFQSQNALRLMASSLSSSTGNFEVHYEVQPLYFSNTDTALYYTNDSLAVIGGTISTANNQRRFKDLDAVLTDAGNHGVVLQNLDRLNYQYSNQYGDLTIGRQVISFGSSRFINPTDIFIPFTLQTLNQEYRVGIDAIRYKADVGDFAMLDMGLVIGEDGKKQNSAVFLRGKKSIKGNDIEAIAIVLDESWLLGAGLERAIGDIGFWFETAYMDWRQTSVDEVQLVTSSSVDTQTFTNVIPYTESYWRTSIGSDYALNEDVIVMFEYHYNGAGSKDAKDYIKLATQAPYQKAGVYLYGQHYIIPAVTWLASPLLSVSASAFYNIIDNSVFFNISSETSWSNNIYSDFGAYFSHGEPISYQNGGEKINYHFGSEFGAYPVSIYASLRYYF